jgi:uncharacterized protein YcnI
MKERTPMRRTALALTAATLLAAPAAAQAHVTIQPKEVPAGSFVRLDVRVPNERDDAGTTKVEVQMPDGVESASYEPVPGWTVEVVRDGSEQVDRVIFTGDGKRGIVEPGQFRDFGLSVRTPDGEAGDTVAFKAVQTYEGGEVVRWIGAEDAEEPAPTITLEEAPGEHGASHAEADDEAVPAAAAPAPAASDDDGGPGTGLAIAALIAGGLGLAAGIAGLMAGRRARAEAGSSHRVATQS